MSKIRFIHNYNSIISVENLLLAWKEFLSGKKRRNDVQNFGRNLMTNILNLHLDIQTKTYTHGSYQAFSINDTKPRSIHKATVRDRLLHRAIYRILYPYFNRLFIFDSYSCRLDKGTHKAIERFKVFARKASRNHTKTLWVLKCDIRKFFASIDQNMLLSILVKHIKDGDTLWLLERIIKSFETVSGKGLPLGNLTSQLLVNIYMNEFDQFVKHKLKARYYIRYADDFVIMNPSRKYLEELLPQIDEFLKNKLNLSLHPDKVFIKTLAAGIDFLGWVHFPHHQVLRTATKRRMFRNIKIKQGKTEIMQSYLGMLKHGNSYKLEQKIKGIKATC